MARQRNRNWPASQFQNVERKKPGFFNPGFTGFFSIKSRRQPFPQFNVLKFLFDGVGEFCAERAVHNAMVA
jgi:hypothetical protein